jgi:hypothetical protein
METILAKQPYLVPLRSEVSSRWCEFCSFDTGREQGRDQYLELQGQLSEAQDGNTGARTVTFIIT